MTTLIVDVMLLLLYITAELLTNDWLCYELSAGDSGRLLLKLHRCN